MVDATASCFWRYICYLKVNFSCLINLFDWCSSFPLSLSIFISGVEAGKKAAGEVLALQKRVLTVLNEARYYVKSLAT